MVQLAGLAYPESLAINQGDTVVFLWIDPDAPGLIESYTGEWRSPVLQLGDTFSRTFNEPGTYVYRIQRGLSNPLFSPALIRVQPVTNGEPAVWISRPLDNFKVPGQVDIEALTTNSPDRVKSVDFYGGGHFIGSITNPPYVVTVQALGTYSFIASVIDTDGHTNMSAPIRINFIPATLVFEPWRLPQNQTVLFASGIGPWCLQWSSDLKTWNKRVAAQLTGNTLIVDETTTNNAPQRFYFIKDCP